MPSKALLAAAHAAHTVTVRDAGGFGVRAGHFDVDFGAVMERVRAVRAQIVPHDSARCICEAGVDLFLGDMSYVARGALEVAGKRLRFARCA